MNTSQARLLLQICAKLQTQLQNDVSMLIHSKKHDGGCSSRLTSVAPTALTVIANRRRRDERYALKARPSYVGAAMRDGFLREPPAQLLTSFATQLNVLQRLVLLVNASCAPERQKMLPVQFCTIYVFFFFFFNRPKHQLIQT